MSPDVPARPRVPELQLDAWKALLRAHAAALDRIEARLAAAGQVPLVEYDVLLELRGAPDGKLRLHDLADRVLLSRSGLTRLVDRLERRAYLRREPDPDDRRGQRAVLTEEGRLALAAAWPEYAAGIEEAFARHFDDAEAAELARLLGRIRRG